MLYKGYKVTPVNYNTIKYVKAVNQNGRMFAAENYTAAKTVIDELEIERGKQND